MEILTPRNANARCITMPLLSKRIKNSFINNWSLCQEEKNWISLWQERLKGWRAQNESHRRFHLITCLSQALSKVNVLKARSSLDGSKLVSRLSRRVHSILYYFLLFVYILILNKRLQKIRIEMLMMMSAEMDETRYYFVDSLFLFLLTHSLACLLAWRFIEL